MTKKIMFMMTFAFFLMSSSSYADNAKGEEAYENGNYQLAFEEFTKAAEKGDADAQYNLGVMYEHGHGVDQSDLKAGEWYQRAADNGHPEAPTALQLLYEYF